MIEDEIIINEQYYITNHILIIMDKFKIACACSFVDNKA